MHFSMDVDQQLMKCTKSKRFYSQTSTKTVSTVQQMILLKSREDIAEFNRAQRKSHWNPNATSVSICAMPSNFPNARNDFESIIEDMKTCRKPFANGSDESAICDFLLSRIGSKTLSVGNSISAGDFERTYTTVESGSIKYAERVYKLDSLRLQTTQLPLSARISSTRHLGQKSSTRLSLCSGAQRNHAWVTFK